MDPYPNYLEEKEILLYFQNICYHIRNITLEEIQFNYLRYFIDHPFSSAYDIKPSNKNSTSYRYAKLTLQKLRNLKLIKQSTMNNKNKNNIHRAKYYCLTDYGLFYLIGYDKLFGRIVADTIKNLFKNYSASRIFQFLVYPFIKADTLCSNINSNVLYSISSYLIKFCQRIDKSISQMKKMDWNIEPYMWNYEVLDEYMEKQYHYNWLIEDNFNDYNTIKFVNESAKDQYISFSLKKDNSIYIYNSIKKKGQISLSNNFIKKRMQILSKEQKRVNHFMSLCDPSPSKFVLSLLPIVRDLNTERILAKDDKFIKALKYTKDDFDKMYDRVIKNV